MPLTYSVSSKNRLRFSWKGVISMNYRHIVFDVDGTLIDSGEADVRGLQDTLEQLTGVVTPLEELRFSQGIPGKDTLQILGIKDIDIVEEQWIKNILRYSDGITPFDGMKETLEALTTRGVKLGVVTSRTHREFDADFPRYGVAHLFGPMICADDTVGHKPEPDPLLRYIELTEAIPQEVLYVGDTINDSLCAQRSGIDFALALWGANDLTIPAEHRLQSPTELLNLPDKAL